MAPPVRDGELIRIFIPNFLLCALENETRDSFIASVTSMGKAFIAARAALYCSASQLLYMTSYTHSDLEGSVVTIFLAGENIDALLTNGGEDEDFLVTDLCDYLHEALYDYLRLIGEEISLDACKTITVKLFTQ